MLGSQYEAKESKNTSYGHPSTTKTSSEYPSFVENA